MEIDRLQAENTQLIEQLREQSKSFCTHCGKLFPKGKEGLSKFRDHIAECNVHPLNSMAREVERLKTELAQLRVYRTNAEAILATMADRESEVSDDASTD